MGQLGQDPGIEETWDIFVLMSCRNLGPLNHVHMAPSLKPQHVALLSRIDLPMQAGEQIVAVIDRSPGELDGTLILTTRQLLQFQGSGAGGTPSGKGQRPNFTLFRAPYGLLPGSIGVNREGGHTVALVLGSGLTMPLPATSPEDGLPEALAQFLEKVGAADRTGIIPDEEGAEQEIRARVRGVLPKIETLTSRIRGLGRDLSTFRRDLMNATPRVIVTPLLSTACVLVFAIGAVAGIQPLVLGGNGPLLEWGANNAARVALRHQEWRLLTSMFLHAGIIHLGLNMWCLVSIGPLVERIEGNIGFGILYLASGIGGAIASMATPPVRSGVGASGAIFGTFGALLAFVVAHRRSIPPSVLKPLRASALSFVVVNTIFGAMFPLIDQAAHLGGLATGFLGGLLLFRPWPVVHSRTRGAYRAIVGLAFLATVCGLGWGVSHWKRRTLPADARLDDFLVQVAPGFLEYQKVAEQLTTALPGPERLRDIMNDPARRQSLVHSVLPLHARARTNFGRLERVITAEPDLVAARDALVAAQASQLATIDAIRSSLDCGDAKGIASWPDPTASLEVGIKGLLEYSTRESAFRRAHGIARQNINTD